LGHDYHMLEALPRFHVRVNTIKSCTIMHNVRDFSVVLEELIVGVRRLVESHRRFVTAEHHNLSSGHNFVCPLEDLELNVVSHQQKTMSHEDLE